MAHTSSIFDSQPIRVQNVNGFDLSHLNVGTALCGTLTPVLCRLLMPRTKFDLGCSIQVELPPLATSFFGRIDAHIEVFFVPCSVLYGGWKQFISGSLSNMFTTTLPGSAGVSNPISSFELPFTTLGTIYPLINAEGNLDLCDYLGIRYTTNVSGSDSMRLSLLPFVAYHRIWDVFYRNPQVTKSIFAVNPNGGSVASLNYKNLAYIWHSYYSADSSLSTGSFTSSTTLLWPDSTRINHMRQRCYPRDYFTAGSISPQQGTAPVLSFMVTGQVDVTTGSTDEEIQSGSGQFTIASLRAVNSLQKFLEACNYDPTYNGVMRAHFGQKPSDADNDEPHYIGRLVVPVYQKSVYTTAESSSSTSQNPFNKVPGSKVASGSFVGQGSICHNYKVGCFGYLMGIFSLVPHAMYGYGIERHNTMLELGDFPFPELQSVGMDSVKNYEVYTPHNSWNGDFSYIPRYSYFKYCDDTVHGLLRPGKSLSSFVLQRVFTSSPSFNTAFCEIPTNALDSVFATTSDVSGFSCWYEIFWVFKATMPLAAFCVPTLGELQDTHEIKVSQGGSRL